MQETTDDEDDDEDEDPSTSSGQASNSKSFASLNVGGGRTLRSSPTELGYV